MFVPNRELGSFLVDARLISREELLRLSQESGDNLYEMIRSRSLVLYDELTRAAAHVLGVPFKEVMHEEIDPEALMLVPEPLSRAHSVAVFRVEGHTAHAALVDLDSLVQLEFLQTERHLRVVPHLTDRASLKRALLIHQNRLKDRFASRLKSAAPDVALEALLSHALLSRASEVYLDAGVGGELRVRYRVQGVLHEAIALPSQAKSLISLLKQSAGLSFTLNAPQEGRFKILLKSGEAVRVGVFSLPSVSGESVLVHLAKESLGKRGFTLESLGLHGEALSQVHHMFSMRSGLVLVAAPAGHGLTTALYTLFDLASHPSQLAVSVEERVELLLPQVTQIEIKKELGQTYASALRAALKSRPDLLMIGEIKDEDTAALAASAASAGVLVIAGLKSASAAKAIQKMLGFGVDPLLLSATLRLTVGGRVVKKLCSSCKEAYKAARADISSLEPMANFGRVLAALKAEGAVDQSMQWKDIEFYRAKGCDECESGYRGTIAFFEALPVSAITKELILDKKAEKEEKTAKLASGLPLTLAEDGLFKAALGMTSIEEVRDAIGE
jgi:type IV pilus assembly protein PilB